MNLKIFQAITRSEIEAARCLFIEYSQSLGFDLDFQDFQAELRSLPGEYFPPHGSLLIASVDGSVAGCIAIRPLTDGVCEMKRMYVCTQHRGKGLGRRLAEEVIRIAVSAGYRSMRLDTLSSMIEAISLYQSLGFQEIEPYRHNPCEGATYMELALQDNPNLASFLNECDEGEVP